MQSTCTIDRKYVSSCSQTAGNCPRSSSVWNWSEMLVKPWQLSAKLLVVATIVKTWKWLDVIHLKMDWVFQQYCDAVAWSISVMRPFLSLNCGVLWTGFDPGLRFSSFPGLGNSWKKTSPGSSRNFYKVLLEFSQNSLLNFFFEKYRFCWGFIMTTRSLVFFLVHVLFNTTITKFESFWKSRV